MEHQEHFGRKFYLDKEKGYWISTDYPRIRAHRWVWINIHGQIPKGYHIHHKDEDKSNNQIENLELIEKSRHIKHHWNEEKRARCKKLMDDVRHLTKKWHASEEGHAWHKLHGLHCWKKRKEITIVCETCGKKTITKTYHQRYCSNSCKSKARRLSGVDDIIKNCERCNRQFISNKYAKQRFCNRVCI